MGALINLLVSTKDFISEKTVPFACNVIVGGGGKDNIRQLIEKCAWPTRFIATSET